MDHTFDAASRLKVIALENIKGKHLCNVQVKIEGTAIYTTPFSHLYTVVRYEYFFWQTTNLNNNSHTPQDIKRTNTNDTVGY